MTNDRIYVFEPTPEYLPNRLNTCVIDTNAYRAYIDGVDFIVEAVTRADITFIPYIVLGELYAGYYNGTKLRENMEVLRTFLAYPFIEELNLTPRTYDLYGKVKTELERKGRMIPHNDIWIASLALETGSTLLTLDKHFTYIDQLQLL
jgi:tRNA(fMet)-specific endonuclease VapC